MACDSRLDSSTYNGSTAHSTTVEPKQLLVVGYFSTPANWHQCQSLVPKIQQAGWQVITTSAKSTPYGRVMDMLLTAWRKRKSYKVAYVDLYSDWAFVWAELVCWVLRRCRKPYMLSLQGGGLPSLARRWPRRFRRLVASARIVAAPSPFLANAVLPFRKDVVLLSHGVDLRLYRFRLRNRPRPRLVWLRSFRQIYNPALAPRVLARLCAEFPEIQLKMIGADRGEGALAETLAVARALHVEHRVICRGGIPKSGVAEELSAHDIFLNTTNFESFGVSVVEAGALGLCIVSTNAGALPFIWTHEVNALLAPPDDPEAMAGAVRRILTEPGLAERLSRNARRRAEQFDWPAVLSRWEESLHSLAQECPT